MKRTSKSESAARDNSSTSVNPFALIDKIDDEKANQERKREERHRQKLEAIRHLKINK